MGDVITDMSKTVGGGATAPTPGWLLRAALASCDATAVAMEAARDGVELTDLTVTVDNSEARLWAEGLGLVVLMGTPKGWASSGRTGSAEGPPV
jgi:organic hydroperoxide reductase OsmC/OhrA